MKTIQELRHFLRKGYLDYRPGLTIDCAIFGYQEGQLQLLLVKNKIIIKWCLPGGYVEKKEDLTEAAGRITRERTGMDGLFLQQFKTFGKPGRNKSPDSVDQEKLFELTGVQLSEDNWLVGETVTIAYYAITDIVKTSPTADFVSSECRWFPINKLPPLAFDHAEIVEEALGTVRRQLYHFPIGKNLLPSRFTLKEIKLFYETMSGKALNPTNFPNKLISLGLIAKTNEKRNIGAHRSPTYYKFNEKAYSKALKEGIVLA